MPFWVPVAITSIAASLAFSEHLRSSRRERAKSRRDAVAKFRSALAEMIAQLDTIDAHDHITEGRVRHDAAIAGLRPLVNLEKIERFDAAVQKFRRGCGEVQPARTKVLASLSSGRPVDYSDTFTLKQALNELLAFADDS